MATSELGSQLRAWRERLTPSAAGLPQQARRRTPGLRREEVAQLAGLSTDYVVRLEQGRARHPSAQVVQALARALRLDEEERDRFHAMAGHAAPTPGRMVRHVTPSIQRIVDRLGDIPVAVIDAAWETVTQNRAADALLGDLSGRSERPSPQPRLAHLHAAATAGRAGGTDTIHGRDRHRGRSARRADPATR